MATLEWRTHLDSVRERTFVPPRPLNSARVVSWNVNHGNDLERLIAAIAENHADLCLLQEVDWGTKRTDEQDIPGRLGRELG